MNKNAFYLSILQCQAQLRALTEQRAKVRELFLREKEHEAKLTASRLESARAEAIADNKAAEVERLRENQVRRVLSFRRGRETERAI